MLPPGAQLSTSLALKGPRAAPDAVGIWVQAQHAVSEEQPGEWLPPRSTLRAKPCRELQSRWSLAWPQGSAPGPSSGPRGDVLAVRRPLTQFTVSGWQNCKQ